MERKDAEALAQETIRQFQLYPLAVKKIVDLAQHYDRIVRIIEETSLMGDNKIFVIPGEDKNMIDYVTLNKVTLNSLISVLLYKSGLSLDDVNQFMMDHYEKWSSLSRDDSKKTQNIDTTELFTLLFGQRDEVLRTGTEGPLIQLNQKVTSLPEVLGDNTGNPDRFKEIFNYWYQHIYKTSIGIILKDILLFYKTDNSVRIILWFIGEFETFIENKKDEHRFTLLDDIKMSKGGGRINIATILLMIVSCMIVFAPSGEFMTKNEVQTLVDQRISSVSSHYQISDRFISNLANKIVKSLDKNVPEPIVKIVNFVDFWRINDTKLLQGVKCIKTVLHFFKNMTDMTHGKTSQGFFDNDPFSIDKTLFVINTLIRLKQSINISTETFLKLLEPKVTENYRLNGGKYKYKHKKTRRIKKHTGRKKQTLHSYVIRSRVVRWALLS